jgi:uncharacterized protein (DUF885 family)
MLAAMALFMTTQTPMQQLSAEYLSALWKTAPMTASQVGYHKDGVDRRLDDLSKRARDERDTWLKGFAARLAAAKPADGEEQADRALLDEAVALERLELETARDYAKRCDRPLDDLGSVFFAMTARAYAPLEVRAGDVAARLQAVPRYLADAQALLDADVEVFRAAAKDDGEGLIDYFEHELVPAFAKTKEATNLKAASDRAVEAVRKYLTFVEKELPKKPKASFRYGRALYEKRFGPYLQIKDSPAEVLAHAEKRFAELHTLMAKLAKQLVPSGDVRAALAKVADDHPPPEQLFATVRKQLDEARAFVIEKQLLSLKAHDNLQVIETPAFLRSQLGVAAFDGAPPLQPELGAFYYVTPFPKDWPKEKIDAKLREYNRYMLALLTIHEAMPGHYVQFEHANRVEPETRRVLRWVLGSGAYIEGWAVYTQDLMVDAGFYHHDPKLQLQQYKLELRAVANAILDIKLHTADLSDEDALKLMMEGAYQERPEAELKLRRAKLSVTQLCSYFVGGEAWRKIRRDAEAHPPFDPRAFHDWALAEGAVPLSTLDAMNAARLK